MNGVAMPGVSAGSNQVGASEMWIPQVIWPSGAAATGPGPMAESRRTNDVAKRLRTVLTVAASFPNARGRARRRGNPRQHSVLARGRVLAGQLGRGAFLLLLLPV